MPLSLDKYRAKLITHILYAQSQNDVSRFINAAIKALEQNKVNGHIIARFVDKIINELNEFNAAGKDAQHWSNIQQAKNLFYGIREKMNTLSH